MPLDLFEMMAAIAIVALGATIQSSVGFGLGLIAAPILLLIDPRFIPAPLMAAGMLLATLVAYRNRQGIDFVSIRCALTGHLFGIALAAWVLSVLPPSVFDLVFSTLVLLAVLLSALGLSVQPTQRWSMVAGATSGFMGTVSSIGGPPMGLLYQRSKGPQIRGTLSGYFSIGTILSLIVLAGIGRFGPTEVSLLLWLLPGIGIGFFVTGPLLAAHLDRTNVRPMVLGLSLVSAIAVLVRAII